MRKERLSLVEISQFVSFLKKYFPIPVCSHHEPNFLMSIKHKIKWEPNVCCNTTQSTNQYCVKLESKGSLGYIRAPNQCILLDETTQSLKCKCAGTTRLQIIERFIEWSQNDKEALSICQQIKVHDFLNDEGSPTVTR